MRYTKLFYKTNKCGCALKNIHFQSAFHNSQENDISANGRHSWTACNERLLASYPAASTGSRLQEEWLCLNRATIVNCQWNATASQTLQCSNGSPQPCPSRGRDQRLKTTHNPNPAGPRTKPMENSGHLLTFVESQCPLYCGGTLHGGGYKL